MVKGKVKKVKRPSPHDLPNGYKLRVVRGPRKGAANTWYFKISRWENGRDRAMQCFWATELDALTQATAYASATASEIPALQHLFNRWFSSAAFGNYTSLTQRKYRENAAELAATFDEYPIERNTVARQIEQWRSQGKAPRTIKALLVCGSSFHKWGRTEGLFNFESAFNGQQLENRAVKVKYTPTDADIERLLPCLGSWHRTVIEIIIGSGMRLGEVQAMQWSDIDWGKGTLYVNGKGNRDRIIKISPKLLERLNELKQDSGAVISVKQISGRNFYHALRLACLEAKVPHYSPHSFRRYVVNKFRKKGILASIAAKHMGHSVIVMESFYASVAEEEVTDAADLVWSD